MAVQIIYHCDICGQEGHCSETPSEKCVNALKDIIKTLEWSIRNCHCDEKRDRLYRHMRNFYD